MNKDFLSEAPLKFAAPLSTLRTLPALFGFKTRSEVGTTLYRTGSQPCERLEPQLHTPYLGLP